MSNKDDLLDTLADTKPGLYERTIAEAGFVLMPIDGFERHTYISELQANMREGKMTERRRCAEIVRGRKGNTQFTCKMDRVLEAAAKEIEAGHD